MPVSPRSFHGEASEQSFKLFLHDFQKRNGRLVNASGSSMKQHAATPEASRLLVPEDFLIDDENGFPDLVRSNRAAITDSRRASTTPVSSVDYGKIAKRKGPVGLSVLPKNPARLTENPA